MASKFSCCFVLVQLLSTMVFSIIHFKNSGLVSAAQINSSSTSTDVVGANLEGISSAAAAISQYLASHNAARQQVGVPPLRWDAGLARFAKAYAAQRRGDCRLVHSPGYAYGENIFWGQGRRWSIPDAVAKWVEEREWYRYDTNSCAGSDCTHYTQIVWRTTALVGCAKIFCNSGDTFMVCEYYPPGNYVGARPYIKKPNS